MVQLAKGMQDNTKIEQIAQRAAADLGCRPWATDGLARGVARRGMLECRMAVDARESREVQFR